MRVKKKKGKRKDAERTMMRPITAMMVMKTLGPFPNASA